MLHSTTRGRAERTNKPKLHVIHVELSFWLFATQVLELFGRRADSRIRLLRFFSPTTPTKPSRLFIDRQRRNEQHQLELEIMSKRNTNTEKPQADGLKLRVPQVSYEQTLRRLEKIQGHLKRPRGDRLKGKVGIITGVGSLKGIG